MITKKSQRSFIGTLIKQTEIPIAQRKPQDISKLIDALRHIGYFQKIHENAGSKILYEYGKYVESLRLSAGNTITTYDCFYIVAEGKILCQNKDVIVREYADGDDLGFLKVDMQYHTTSEVMLIVINEASLKRLSSMERTAVYGQKKKFQMPKFYSGYSHLLSELRKSGFFATFSTFQLRQFILASRSQSYIKGQKIFQEGRFPNFLFYVLSGQVVIQYTEGQAVLDKNIHKKKQTISMSSVVNQNDVFGLEQMMTEQFYKCYATPVNQANILLIPVDVFKQHINPILSKSTYENLMILIETKKTVLEKNKNSYGIYRDFKKSTDIEGIHSFDQRLRKLSNSDRDKIECRTSVRTKPYRSYLPYEILHQNTVNKTIIRNENSSLGLIEEAMKKANDRRTLSPIRTNQMKSYAQSPTKFVFQRLIINKLEEFQTNDSLRFIDSTIQQHGSTLNFFRLKHRTSLNKQPRGPNIKRLSMSQQKTAL